MSESKRIEVEARGVNGNTKYYPANEAARVLASIAGTKTLSLRTLDYAAYLGHEIVEVFAARDAVLCEQGLHANIKPLDSRQYAPGNTAGE